MCVCVCVCVCGGGGGGEGHFKKSRQGCPSYFFGFEISQIVIFWVAQNEGYFMGVENISINFWVNKKFALFFFGLLKD